MTTGSMTIGVDRMHLYTRRRLLFSAASSRCGGHCGTTLANNTRPEQKQVQLLIFEECESVLPILCRPVIEVAPCIDFLRELG